MKYLISTALGIIAATLSLSAEGYRYVVIPVEFQNTRFRNKTENVDAKIVRAQLYFNDQFSPRRTFSFDLLPVVTLQKDFSWYGENSTDLKDKRIDQLVRDACNATGRDFSAYDNDGNGTVDNICIITAGSSEADGAGADWIWPQQAFLSERGGAMTVGSKTIDSFSICAESSGLGTFCHEFAHSFGLQDLYDTDGSGSGGTSTGVWGSLSIMDKGLENDGGNTPPNFSAIELEQLGIGNPVAVKHGSNILSPTGSSKEYIRLESDTKGEYFLLECRDASGWDAFAGGTGLIIYHIDRSANGTGYSDYYKGYLDASERWQYNQANCSPAHQCARVVAAVPGTGTIGQVFFPQQGHTSFGSETQPPFRFWSGDTSGQAIDHIERLSDGSISFNLLTPVTVKEISTFQDAAIISWSVDNLLDVQDCEVQWSADGSGSTGQTRSTKVSRQSDGNYFTVLEGLAPSTRYKVVIRLICSGGAVHSKAESFTTKTMLRDMLPFIYLNSAERRVDGSFIYGDRLPLRVYNATDAVKVEWFFNEEPIQPDSDGFWRMKDSGILKAKVWYKDNSADIIAKTLIVR